MNSTLFFNAYNYISLSYNIAGSTSAKVYGWDLMISASTTTIVMIELVALPIIRASRVNIKI